MLRIVPIAICLAFSIACGPSANTSTASKTNVNLANKVPYENTENAYSLAQRDVDLYPLDDSVGKTASEIKLWEQKEIVKKFKQLIGPEYPTMVRSWNTETPIKKFGDVRMLSGCERDNCSNNRYVIFISLSEGLLSIVHIGDNSIREWQTRRNYYQALPPPFAEELDKWKSQR